MADNWVNAVCRELREECRTRTLVPSIAAGVVNGVVGTSMFASLALLIFSGDLSQYASAGIGMALAGGVVVNVVVALRGSGAGVFCGPGDGPAAILSLAAASIAQKLSAEGSPEEIFATVAAAVLLTTLLSGVLFFALGQLRVGSLVRFIPYPVIGGFLAGMGWLLFKGSIGVMVALPAGFSEILNLAQTDALVRWGPGVVYGVVLFTVLRYSAHFLTMPVMLLVGLAAFYLGLLCTGTSVAEASARGWLLEGVPGGTLWRPPGPGSFAAVNWRALLGEGAGVVTLMLVGLVQLLLYVSSFELATQKDLDLDRELQTVGIGNVLTCFANGMGGYHWPGLSTLAFKAGGSTRLMSLAASLALATALFAGASLVSYFPKPVLAGLLAYLGVSWLAEWVWSASRKLSRSDYVVVLVILLVIATVGVLEGVGLGILAAAVIFVIKYSRIDVVKNTLTGETLQSNIDRPPHQRDLLRKTGRHVYILKLQGFIFFGTSNKLLAQVRERARDAALPGLRFAILDFRQVTGVDSSALMSFMKMRQLAETCEFVLVFTAVSDELNQALQREGFSQTQDQVFNSFPSLDHGVEWCENESLASENEELDGGTQPLMKLMAEQLREPEAAEKLMRYLEKRDASEGEYLMRQGAAADEIYFIESGWVTVQLELETGSQIRLRRMGPGTVVGEMGVYTGAPRSASIVMDDPGTVYRLSAENLRKMENEEPGIASQFHQFVVRLLAERLSHDGAFIRALLE